MELIDGTVAKQVDNHARRDRFDVGRDWGLRGVDDGRLPMSAAEVIPRCLRVPVLPAETERFFGEHEPVRVDVCKAEPVLVPTLLGTQGKLGVHARRSAVAAVQLVVGATVPLYELAETGRPEHPAQHLEEAHEIGLP